MSRVDVYITAGSEHRDVAIGGRQANTRGWAKINTDNATHRDCSVKIKGGVVGERQLNGRPRKTCDCGYVWHEEDANLRECPTCAKERQGIDTRESFFRIELPKQDDEFCSVELVENGHDLRQLAFIGAGLAAMKGLNDVANGDVKQGIDTLAAAEQIVSDIERQIQVPNVTLPGGYTLKHALACIEFVKRIQQAKQSNN